MKKAATAAGILVLTALLAYPAFARGPGWLRGTDDGPPFARGAGWWGGVESMPRPSGYGPPWNGWRDREGRSTLTPEQRDRLEELDRSFALETEPLRSAVRIKAIELDAVLAAPEPEGEKAKALQKDISELMAKFAEKRLEFHLQARKLGDDDRYRRGRGMGYGYAESGKGYRRGGGPCWY